MDLDPRTLIVASLLCAVLLGGLSLAFVTLVRSDRRLVAGWGRGMLVMALGILGIASRGAIPDWISVGVANGVLIGGIALAADSLRRVAGLRSRDAVNWTVVAALLTVMLVLSGDASSTPVRIGAVALAFTIIVSRAALVLHRWKPAGCARSLRFTRTVLWAVVLVSLVRLVGAVATRPESLMGGDNINAVTILSYAGVIVVVTLGVILIELELGQRDLVQAARFDDLTGLLNRGTFLEELDRHIESARPGDELSLAIFDLDNFKSINDTHGHLVGDRVLHTFALVLSTRVRRGDLVARYGGEEFALLMPATDKDHALAVSEDLRRHIADRGVTVDDRKIDLTVSGGVASLGTDGGSTESLMLAADTALYRAKHGGRNTIRSAAGSGGTTAAVEPSEGSALYEQSLQPVSATVPWGAARRRGVSR